MQVEALGGDTLAVEVSATKHIDLDKLLEAIALQAELLDLRPIRTAGRRHRHRSAARSRPRSGRHRAGAARHAAGRRSRRRRLAMGPGARANRRHRRQGRAPVRRCRSRSSAFPARRRPATGSRSSKAKRAPAKSPNIATARSARSSPRAAACARSSLADMMSQLKTAGRKEFPIVIKGDVQGSVEAIIAALDKLDTDEVARARHSRRRRRHHRIRRDACRGLEAVDHRLQRARPQGGARPRRAGRASKSATTTSSTTSSMT